MRSMWRHTSRGSPVRTLPQKLGTGRRAISRLMLRTRAPPLVRPCGGPWRGFAARTKKLQDIRGEYQDAVVAEERLRSLVDGDYRRPVRLPARAADGALCGLAQERGLPNDLEVRGFPAEWNGRREHQKRSI